MCALLLGLDVRPALQERIHSYYYKNLAQAPSLVCAEALRVTGYQADTALKCPIIPIHFHPGALLPTLAGEPLPSEQWQKQRLKRMSAQK